MKKRLREFDIFKSKLMCNGAPTPLGKKNMKLPTWKDHCMLFFQEEHGSEGMTEPATW